jgi:hypothetical protein
MIIQWCCKGIRDLPERDVRQMLMNRVGLRCRYWIGCDPNPFPVADAMEGLTEQGLDLHVNHYDYQDPATGRPYYETTPFISLSAGCVDRNTTVHTNKTYRAFQTALDFATIIDHSQPAAGRRPGWVLVCYVLVSVNPAVSIPSVAEEIRELNHNRAYSQWYWQGEITAKINVPSAQILSAARWEPRPANTYVATNLLLNRRFVHPAALLDERNML